MRYLKLRTQVTSNRLHGNTFENAQWRKVKQIQPIFLCILSGTQFEDTFENAQWIKIKQKKQCNFASSRVGNYPSRNCFNPPVLYKNMLFKFFLKNL